MLPDNLGHLFHAALRLIPSHPAVFQDDLVLTFEDLDTRCNQMANALTELGVRVGDRVALMFTNDFRFLESFLGPMRIGAVSVPVNIRMSDEAVSYVIRDAEARVVIANAAMADRARSLASGAPSVRHVILDAPPANGSLEYDELLKSASPRTTSRVTRPDEVCMQPYTSGSTGKPKGVLLTHGGQIWNADVMRKATMRDHTDRALVAVPLFHKNALIGAVKPTLVAGGSLVILPGFDALAVIAAIERYRVTFLTGVPAMFKMILAEREALARHDVSSVRYAVCGSAEVPEDLADQFNEAFHAPLAESYGLTEGGPVPLANTRWGLKKRGSCGMAIPGCDVKLVGDDGETEVGVNSVGELITRNPGVATGYWKLPDITARKIRDGWLFTGDLFRRDADGYFYFVGRQDDMMNVSGENVYPKEVEDILAQHPDICDVYVVPTSHPVKGQVPVAFIVVRNTSDVTEQEIQRFFLDRGTPYAYPRRVHFVKSVPLSSTGKPDRAAMKDLASGDFA